MLDPRSVVIVEDNFETRHAMQLLLESDGFCVRCAQSFAEGVNALATGLPAFVLLDLTLPDGDGTHLIDMIRQRQAEHAPTKIAVLSGSVDLDPARKTEVSRADEVFIKPIHPEALLGWMAQCAPPVRAIKSPGAEKRVRSSSAKNRGTSQQKAHPDRSTGKQTKRRTQRHAPRGAA